MSVPPLAHASTCSHPSDQQYLQAESCGQNKPINHLAHIWTKRMKNSILHTTQILFERWWLATNLIISTYISISTENSRKAHMLAGKIAFLLWTIIIYSTYFLISPHIGCKSILYFTLCHYVFGRRQRTKWQRIYKFLICHWL